jgi:hypothetical protein
MRPRPAPNFSSTRYLFDLTRHGEGLVFAARIKDGQLSEPSLPDRWVCTAKDDGDAVRQALAAAEREWPRMPGRRFNDFVIKFVAKLE